MVTVTRSRWQLHPHPQHHSDSALLKLAGASQSNYIWKHTHTHTRVILMFQQWTLNTKRVHQWTPTKTNMCSWQKAVRCWTGDLPLTLYTVLTREGSKLNIKNCCLKNNIMYRFNHNKKWSASNCSHYYICSELWVIIMYEWIKSNSVSWAWS